MATPTRLPSGPMSSSWVRGTRNGWAIERLEEARHGLRINAGAVVRNPYDQGDIHGYDDSLAKLAAARRTVARRSHHIRGAGLRPDVERLICERADARSAPHTCDARPAA